MPYFELLSKRARQNLLPLTLDELEKARAFAEKYSATKTELEAAGAVTKILSELSPDPDILLASILSKCSALPDAPYPLIASEFGPAVCEILETLHKLNRLTALSLRARENDTDILRKMFLALAKDIRVVFIRLADCLYRLQQTTGAEREQRLRLAHEVFLLYSPIAARLGIYRLKRELEDTAFALLNPQEYMDLQNEITALQKVHPQLLEQGRKFLQKVLQKHGVSSMVHARIKNPYSIWQKLQRKELHRLTEVHDLFAFRILVPTVPDCYAALGILHQQGKVLSARFKDYISFPKPNGYQSLHTGLMAEFGRNALAYPVEVQVRTFGMHEASEFGSAVHWQYKEDRKRVAETNWFASLAKASRDLKSAHTFEIFAKEFLGDRIYVLTEQGDIKILPERATPLDFAYAVHTEIGHHCQSAMVNGHIVPLHTVLENGDVVRILTNKKILPRESWLGHVVSNGARQRIRTYLHLHEEDYFIREGRRLVNQALKSFQQPPLDAKFTLLSKFSTIPVGKLKERENLLKRIGIGDLKALSVVKKILDLEEVKPQRPLPQKAVSTEPVLVEGESGFALKKPKCCTPLSPQPIMAFTTRGGNFTIHSISCRMLEKLDPERLLPASWESSNTPENVKISVTLKSFSKEALAEIRTLCLRQGVQIRKVERIPKTAKMVLHGRTYFPEVVEALLKKLQKLSSVEKVVLG